MNRRSFLGSVAATSAAAATAAVPALATQSAFPRPGESYRPNVLWIIADQWRGQALAANGDPNARTPNVDRLAASGVNFVAARSGFPLCSPFRGSMLTGLYPHHCVPGHEYPLPPDKPTVAHAFNEAGYETAFFGKWHLDGFHESAGRAAEHIVPPSHRGGFQRWLGYENNNSPFDSWVHGGSGATAARYKLPGYETDALTDILLSFLREPARSHKPFFAVLSVQPPHDPYIAPPETMRNFNPAHIELRPNVPPVASIQQRARLDLAGYYAQIENLDTSIGRVLATLEQQKLLDHTHIMVFSDHGDQHASHGQFLKTSPYEEAMRIPMIISGEVSFYSDRITNRSIAPFNSVDVAPTTLGLCGIPVPRTMEGYDYSGKRLAFRPLLNEPDSMYLQLVIPTRHFDSVNAPYRGVVTRDGWKYVCLANQSWMMFDLNEDPYELVNLAFNERYKQQRARLIARTRQWAADTGDKFDIPAD